MNQGSLTLIGTSHKVNQEKKGMTKGQKAVAAIGGVGAALGVGAVGAGALLGLGGLAIVTNPFDLDYNAEDLYD